MVLVNLEEAYNKIAREILWKYPEKKKVHSGNI